MKINIIYESQFGNGKKVIDELTEILKGKGQEVELFPITDIKTDELPDADLYIFSSPTRKFMLPRIMGRFIKGFEPASKNAGYALMTTYMDPRTIALKKMEAILKKKGMNKVTEDLKIKVLGLKGPLEDDYSDELNRFVEGLIK